MSAEELIAEELIKDLCVRAIAAEGADFRQALDELHVALKEHIENLRAQPQDSPET
jgi:hypothetical protein